MQRSCGDDCVDQLTEKVNKLHAITSLLNNSTGKGFKFSSRDTSETVSIDLDTIEGRTCDMKIRESLEEYAQAEIKHLVALAIGKIDEVNH